MTSAAFHEQIRDLIRQDELDNAVIALHQLLNNSPKLEEAILQSGRLTHLKKQVRLGNLSFEEAAITRNQIRAGLLELTNEIEGQLEVPEIQNEVNRYVQSIAGKNIVAGNITAGGSVTIGDQIHQVTESKTSRNLRVFLFVLVPAMAILAAVLYYQYQQSKQPLSLAVTLNNTTPNPDLPFPGGQLTLIYDGEPQSKEIHETAVFRGIPPNFRNEEVTIRFRAEGFVPIDTNIQLTREDIQLDIQRDDTYARVYGVVIDEESLQPLKGVHVSINDLSSKTNAEGKFNIDIPFEKQRKKQRLSAVKKGYDRVDFYEPVVKNEETRIGLRKTHSQ